MGTTGHEESKPVAIAFDEAKVVVNVVVQVDYNQVAFQLTFQNTKRDSFSEQRTRVFGCFIIMCYMKRKNLPLAATMTFLPVETCVKSTEWSCISASDSWR